MNDTYSIYMHINKINNKKYIGQTKLKPKDRWGKNGNGYKNQYFYNAIQKYGWNNFEHLILEDNLTEKEVNIKEKYWIKFYNTIVPNGYNISPGGTNLSTETRKKMSIKTKENWAKASEQRHEQQKELMIKLNKTLDRTGKNNSMYGKHRFGKDAANKKKVRCIETGQIFKTVTDASKWCNNGQATLRSHIAQQIQGKRKSCGKHPITHVPLHWIYIN